MTPDLIDRTVRQVGAGLPLIWWRYRRSALQEIDAGLRDAQAAHVAAGVEPGEAARRAVEEFGDPSVVADELRTDAGARAVGRLGAVQAVLLVTSVVAWATVGSTNSTAAPTNTVTVAVIYALFLAVALPAVVVGLVAHRRLARPMQSATSVRRWGTCTAGALLLTLAATRCTSLLKARVGDLPVQPGDAVLTAASSVLGLALLVWALTLLVQMHRLGRHSRLVSA